MVREQDTQILKELNSTPESMKHQKRIQLAGYLRDYNDNAEQQKKSNELFKSLETSVDVSSSKGINGEFDKVGITVAYPNFKSCTHSINCILPMNIGGKGFSIKVKQLYQELVDKIKG